MRLAKNAIKKEGMLDIVNEYASLIEANITAKEITLAITVAYLQMPIEQVKLVWFDFDKKRRVEKPMPTYKISE